MFHYVETFRPLEMHVQIADPSEEGLRAHFENVSRRMRERQHLPRERRYSYVIQHTGTGFRQANAKERGLLAEWLKRDFELMQGTSLGVGFVIDSTMIRGALTAVFWLSKMPMPHRVHATLEEAVATALRELETAKLPVHERLRFEGSAALLSEQARLTTKAALR